MLMSIISMLIVFALIGWAHAVLTGNLWGFRDPITGNFMGPALAQAIGASVAVGAICLFAPMLSGWTIWLSILMYAAIVAGFVNLFMWWRAGGNLWHEMIPFAALALMFALVAGSAVTRLASLIPVAFLAALVTVSPWLLFLAFLGFMIAGTLIDYYRNGGRQRFFVLGVAVAVICGLLFFGTLYRGVQGTFDWENLFNRHQVTNGIEGSNLDLEGPGDAAPTTTANPKSGWKFRHDAVIADNYDSNGKLLEGEALEQARLNDYDFGLSVLDEAIARRLASGEISLEDLANKSEEELFNLVGENVIVQLMVDAVIDDPALGAAVMGYHDALFGTREFLGDFFTQYQDEPDRFMKAMNAAKDNWVLDQAAYYKVVQHWINIIETAKTVKVDYQSSGITDQMYQHGAVTLSENDYMIPDDIVMESYDHSGFFIVFTYVVKETKTITVAYRIDCGFQPCNVSRVLETTPVANPNGSRPSNPGTTPSNPGGGKPAGGNPGNGGNGQGGDPGTETPPATEQQDPPITNPKDPEKGTKVPVNDVPGPGPDTNNGVGSQWSSVQEPEASVMQPSAADHDKAMEPVRENPARPAGTSNAPSYNPVDEGKKAPDAVDNNGDKGTGYGGADVATPEKPPADVDVPSYNPDSNKVEWGAPPL